VNTTVVALLPIAAILVVGFTKLGPGTLLDLSLALFVGIAVGAYSSIFIATPLLVDLRRREPAVKELDKVATRSQAKTEVGVPVGAGAPRAASSANRGEAPDPGQAPDAVGAPDSAGATAVGAGADVGVGAAHAARSAPGTPTDAAPREVHKWAQSGPRNQPKRPPRSKR